MPSAAAATLPPPGDPGVYSSSSAAALLLDPSFFDLGKHLNLRPPIGTHNGTLWATDLPHVRAQLEWVLSHERWLLHDFLSVFQRRCLSVGATFVDSGANDGLWTLLAAAHGCHVLAVEPQPLCHASLRVALAKNGFGPAQVELLNLGLAPTPQNFTLPSSWCSGTTRLRADGRYERYSGSRPLRAPSDGNTAGVHVATARLDELASLRADATPQRHIVLWHLDTEGAELPCLQSASRLMRERRIERISLEFDKFAILHLGSYGLPHLASTAVHGRVPPQANQPALEAYGALLDGCRCVVACTGAAFNFSVDSMNEFSFGRRCPRGARPQDLTCRCAPK